MFLIHEELAKQGIIQLINKLLTDYDISQRMYLVIVGNFDDNINRQAKKQENLDYYLYGMLRHYERKKQVEMTIVNLHEYKNKLFSPYSDSVLPVFKITKDNFTHKGTEELKVDPPKIVTHTQLFLRHYKRLKIIIKLS
ncbi:hypothetical protein [Bacillus sp. AFS088145]|uniref:Ger(x)C family spore germination protein n=1 Tax=Bacillus sp. AFS088145 TaxID=2033514 RepID=UPI001155D84F|nr:hypothetical protein [Bacillus sp. AFS088145]